MTREQLDSELRQLTSLESEEELLNEVASQGRLTEIFIREHAAYLAEQARAAAKKLSQATPAPGLESELQAARDRARRLAPP
jgi:hypothetical protein